MFAIDKLVDRGKLFVLSKVLKTVIKRIEQIMSACYVPSTVVGTGILITFYSFRLPYSHGTY